MQTQTKVPDLLEACKLARERVSDLNALTPKEYQQGQGARDIALLDAAIAAEERRRAAGPDLLEALVAVASHIDPDTPSPTTNRHEVLAMVRAAIARATA